MGPNLQASLLKQKMLQHQRTVLDFFKNETMEKEGVSQIKVVGEQAKIAGTARIPQTTMSDIYMSRFAKTKDVSATAWKKCYNK